MVFMSFLLVAVDVAVVSRQCVAAIVQDIDSGDSRMLCCQRLALGAMLGQELPHLVISAGVPDIRSFGALASDPPVNDFGTWDRGTVCNVKDPIAVLPALGLCLGAITKDQFLSCGAGKNSGNSGCPEAQQGNAGQHGAGDRPMGEMHDNVSWTMRGGLHGTRESRWCSVPQRAKTVNVRHVLNIRLV